MHPIDIPDEDYQKRMIMLFRKADEIPWWGADIAKRVRKEALKIKTESIVEYDRACDIIQTMEDIK
mgnify:CR=1 FL=1